MKAKVSLKEQKEAFVTGHNGTTSLEILVVCLSAPISLACHQAVEKVVRPRRRSTLSILLEALLVWFPMVLCQTNYLYPYGVMIMMLQIVVVVAVMMTVGQASASQQHSNRSNTTTAAAAISSPSQRLEYLTAYRSSILYLTFIAILAVDFHVFPRRFCKTEIAGFGLMDVGAASFCYSAGLVSPKARGKPTSWKKLIETLPLIALGCIRIWTNRELEYQEHISEYGIHWNFFFTMGILALIPPLVPGRTPSWVLPLSILGVYQAALSLGGLQDFVVYAPRHCPATLGASILCSIMAANREGILGCLGYLSLYFMGEWVGHQYLWKPQQLQLQQEQQGLGALFQLSLFLWLIMGILHWGLNIPISRRSTNAAFCLWAAAHNTLLLSCLQYTITTRVPLVWETVNKYGLFMFLIANLLTGLVNLTIPTLEMPDPMALAIVFGYICVVGMASLLLDTLWVRFVPSKHSSTHNSMKKSQ